MKFPSSLMRPRKPQKSIRTILLNKKMQPVPGEGSVNLVLSPSLYWFREVVLPAKTAVQAKKLAPSYFDTVIPEGEYEYMAIARPEVFWLFAYNVEQIMDALNAAGLKPSQVEAVYFAQTECQSLAHPYRIDDHTALVVSEGVVSVIASRYVHAAEDINPFLTETVRSRHKLNISMHHTGWLDEKQLHRLTGVTIVLLAVYLANFVQLRHQFNGELAKEYAIQERYKLPGTSFQLNSLLSTLEGTERRQLKLRTVFRQLTALPLKKGESVTSLAMDEKKAELQILLAEPTNAENIKTALSKVALVTAAKVKDQTFYVSIAYE